jgi:drug/metabolite transporter (DMT)-like permease
MQNKYIIHLIIASILWGLVPVLVYGLFAEISILMLIFLRFFISGVVFLGLSLIYIYLNNKSAVDEQSKIKLKDLMRTTLNKNKNFYNIYNLLYYSFLGFFGIILQIIGYFLALKTTSIAFTMIGFQLSIIIIAFYEHGVNSEKLDFFKFLYLLILIFSIGIIIFVKLQEPDTIQNPLMGIFYIILFTASLTFLQIGLGKESYTKSEIKLINVNQNYKMARLMFRIALIFLTGIGIMFPFLIIIASFPVKGDLTSEINLFFNEFSALFQILMRWEVLFLIVFSTIVPYILFFMAEANWSPYELTYNQWIAIIAVIEPICGIFLGVLIINEYFPTEYLIIVLFLLMISILFRYAHESKNKVNAFLLINHKFGMLDNLPLKLLKFNGICNVSPLIGKYDLLLNVKTNSIKDLYYLIDTQLRSIEGIKNIEILFIKNINKLEITSK